MNTTGYLVLIIAALLAGMVILPQFMMRRAIRSVIKILQGIIINVRKPNLLRNCFGKEVSL